jgi:hypothetical protein
MHNGHLEKELEWSFVLSSMDGKSGGLYTSAADTHLLHCLPAGAVYFGLSYRYICLFHHR